MAQRTRAQLKAQVTGGGVASVESQHDQIDSFALQTEVAALDAGEPTGPAGGVLTGEYPNPGLANTTVTPGTYTNATVTVGPDGRVTAIESGASVGGGGYTTPGQLVAALETLADDDRLNSTAIRNLSTGGSGTVGRVTLTRPGISVDVEFNGTAPTLSGSNGSYTMTIPVGCSWRVIDIFAAVGSSATNGNTFAFTVANENEGDPTDRAIAQIKDTGTNEILEWPKQERNITRTETIASAGQVTNTWTAIGALDGFAILLTR